MPLIRKPNQVWPVRVAAGAFGPGRPHNELFLSPDHAVYVGGVLIPIRHLINASTIAQVAMDHVTCYHIELLQHDVVLVQGLPAESFLDSERWVELCEPPWASQAVFGLLGADVGGVRLRAADRDRAGTASGTGVGQKLRMGARSAA